MQLQLIIIINGNVDIPFLILSHVELAMLIDTFLIPSIITAYASESMEKNDPSPIYSLYAVSNHMGEWKSIENETTCSQKKSSFPKNS